MESVRLTSEEITKMYRDDENLVATSKGKFKFIESDTSTGDFDAEKGSMIGYEIYIEDENGKMYTGVGGYYNACAGESFNYDITFYEEEEEEYQPDEIEPFTEEELDELKDELFSLGVRDLVEMVIEYAEGGDPVTDRFFLGRGEEEDE